MRKLFIILILFLLTSCFNTNKIDENNNDIPIDNNEEVMNNNDLYLLIDNKEIDVTWLDNESVNELKELVKEEDITISMSMYGGFEQVGSLGTNIKRNDSQMTTSSGDIVLYSGNQIVLFYGSNSWSYTKLGKMNLNDEELKNLLGDHDVTITLTSSKKNKETILLNNGIEMPIIGLGTWTLDNEEAENSVYYALKYGMRLIDTARYYRNEVGVGKGIKKAIEEGICQREDIFVTSKIMPSDYDRASQGIKDSLKDLDLEYLDLILIHQPGSNDKAVYKAMEDAYNEGLVRSIGISNYYTNEELDEVLSYANITPSIIQNENHIYYQNNKLQEYANKYDIKIESWYPFGGRGNTKENFENEIIKELANKYQKTSAQIILRWHIQANYIVIPGSSNPEHIKENYDIFDFELSKEDMEKISKINENRRYENW